LTDRKKEVEAAYTLSKTKTKLLNENYEILKKQLSNNNEK
jgi:hypothetical protein